MQRPSSLFLGVLLFLSVALPCSQAADPKECEVCIKVLETIDSELQGGDKKKTGKIEAAIDKYCSRKDLHQREKKICYFFEPIKREISVPFSTGMPKAKVCDKLKKKSAEICSIKYPVKVDSDTDYTKLRVKELKAILAQRGVDCVGCLEKDDYVKKAQATAHMEL